MINTVAINIVGLLVLHHEPVLISDISLYSLFTILTLCLFCTYVFVTFNYYNPRETLEMDIIRYSHLIKK